jgi:EmrB/QacA subfamily drug resistance transporter
VWLMSRSQRLVLLIAIVASFVAFLSGTVITVALPKITAELGGGLAGQQWAMNAYLITLGSLILVAGSLSDAVGKLFILRLGLIGFAVASLAIAVAPTIELLIAFRAVQGAAGALLVPSSLALIIGSFRGPAQGRAIGVWTSATSAAAIIGPLVGGLLADFWTWRWAFVINVVPIAVALLLIHRLDARDVRVAGIRIDVVGAVLCTYGLGAMVFALIEGPSRGWGSVVVLTSLISGAIAFVFFLVRQRHHPNPIVPLDLFKVRNFWTGNVATAFVYAALSLNGFVLGVYLQQTAGLPATLAGLASLPMTIIMILGSSRIGGLSGRFGPRVFMTVGPIIMAAGSLMLLAVSADFNYWHQVLPGVFVFGLGLTVTVAPLTSAILGSVPTERSGSASAVNNAVARIAGLIVVAVLAVIVGGQIDLEGFHRAAVVTAALLALGGIASWAGIRNPAPAEATGAPVVSPAPCVAGDVPVTTRVNRAVSG